MTADLAPWESAQLADLDEPTPRTLTLDESGRITDAFWHEVWADPGRRETCLEVALGALSSIATGQLGTPEITAADALRQVEQRVRDGELRIKTDAH